MEATLKKGARQVRAQPGFLRSIYEERWRVPRRAKLPQKKGHSKTMAKAGVRDIPSVYFLESKVHSVFD